MKLNDEQLNKAIKDHLSLEKQDLITDSAKVFDVRRPDIVDFLLLQKRDSALRVLNIDIPDHIENIEEILENFVETTEQLRSPVTIRHSLQIVLDYLVRQCQYENRLIGAL